MILRASVDAIDPKTGLNLTDQQVSEVLISLLYVSSENTALGLAAAITDLATHSEYWNEVYREGQQCLKSGNMKALTTSRLIDSCLMESARMNSHALR